MFRTVSGIAASLLVATTVVMGLLWTHSNDFTGFLTSDYTVGSERGASGVILPDDEQTDEKRMDDALTDGELVDRLQPEPPDWVRDPATGSTVPESANNDTNYPENTGVLRVTEGSSLADAGNSVAEKAGLNRDVERSRAPTEVLTRLEHAATDRDENLIMQDEPGIQGFGSTSGVISDPGSRVLTAHSLPVSSRLITINQTKKAKPLLLRAESYPELAADMRMAGSAEVETARNGSATAQEDRKYQLGISYGPRINMHQRDTRWGLGAGVNLDRKITRNLSVSSGIMIAQNRMQYDDDRHVLESDQQRTFIGTGNEQNREMNSRMEADLISFEVPVNLKFSLTDQVYVLAGISSATYVREQYDYRMEFEQEFTQLAFEDGAGFRTETTTVMVSETEQQSEPSFSSFHPLAFYNFAIGYNRFGTERSRFTFEPYLKIPTGNLTSREIRYTTAGIQMVISL